MKAPPLVFSGEIEQLKRELADASEGKRFVLQGGDCAETFDDCTSERLAQKLKILLQMSLIISHGLGLPIVRIGRIAGQFAKPRSQPFVLRDGQKIFFISRRQYRRWRCHTTVMRSRAFAPGTLPRSDGS